MAFLDPIAPKGIRHAGGEAAHGPPARPHRATARGGRLDAVTVYMNGVRRHPILSREEEHALAVHYASTGDPEAARKLLTSNLRLVVKIAHQYRRSEWQLQDLIQEGNLGLLTALRKFDPARGVKLSTYATWWIRAYILEYILDNERLVRVGTTAAQRKLFFGLRKQREKLAARGIHPTAARIASEMSVSERDVVEMSQRLERSDVSLDAPIGSGDDDARTRMELVASDEAGRPDVVAEDSEFWSRVREKVEAFGEGLDNARAKHILRERLLTDSPETLQEIGARYGISRERARQLESRLKRKLRAYLADELGDAVETALAA
jgi:RNA polymerase sigma-32 factor